MYEGNSYINDEEEIQLWGYSDLNLISSSAVTSYPAGLSPINVKPGDTLIVEAGDVNNLGQGVAKPRGLPVVFVDRLLPRELAQVKVVEVKRDWIRAEVVKLLRISPLRVEPICPHYEECGGCQLSHLAYPHQFHLKLSKLAGEIERVLNEFIPIEEFYYSPPFKYRNKVTLFMRDRQLGYYKQMSHQLVDIKLCLLMPDGIYDAFTQIRELLLSSNISAYNEQEHKGLVRALTFRQTFLNLPYPSRVSSRSKEKITSFSIRDASQHDYSDRLVFTSDLMLIVTLNIDRREFRKNEECLRLVELLTKINVPNIIFNFNPERTNRIFGRKWLRVKGRAQLRQCFKLRTVGEICYHFGPLNFFQVNPYVTPALIDTVVEWLDGQKAVLDLYSGVGTFSLALRKAGIRKLTAIEIDSSVLKMIHRAVLENDLERYQVIIGDVEQVVTTQLIEEFPAVILDPPRRGLPPELLKKLAKAKQIVYVSCNVSTMIRDLKVLKSLGFSIVKARVFDMFPQTTHIEVAVLLSK